MKDWIPKVGDIVVRDPEYWKNTDVDIKTRHRVTSACGDQIKIDNDPDNRYYEYWMLDKNAIVTKILNDL